MNRHGRTRRALITAGALIMGYAVTGALTDPDIHPGRHLVWLTGVLAAHDVVVLPAAVGIGAVIGRFVPATARAAIQAAGLVTATLLVVAAPLLLGPHPRPGNPSVLPGSYLRGCTQVVGAVWTAAGVAVLRRRWPTPGRADHRQRSAPPPEANRPGADPDR